MLYEDHIILEAIDQLRLRKARPDFHRISNFLIRNFSVSPSEVKAALDKCIQKEIVLKVEYKGNISYRNATRSKRSRHEDFSPDHPFHKSHSPLMLSGSSPSRKFRALLINAFAELIVHEPDYLYDGVPGNELIAKILAKDTVRSYTKKYLGVLIEKIASNGVLLKVPESGNYLLGPKLHEEASAADSPTLKKGDDKTPKRTANNVIKDHANTKKICIEAVSGVAIKSPNKMDTGSNNNSNESVRVGSRRKRAKIVFDPSDNHKPARRRGRPPILRRQLSDRVFNKPPAPPPPPKDLSKDIEAKWDAFMNNSSTSTNREQGGVCSVCHNNKKSPTDHLVSCHECSNKAHFSCLNGDDMMLKISPDNVWRCPHCKTCCVCYETSDAGVLMICSICTDAYHGGCHDPPITEMIKNGTKWLCNNCQKSEQLQVTEIHPKVLGSDPSENEVTENEIPKESEAPESEAPESEVPGSEVPEIEPQENIVPEVDVPENVVLGNLVIKQELHEELDIKEEMPTLMPFSPSFSTSESSDSKDSLLGSRTSQSSSAQLTRSPAHSPDRSQCNGYKKYTIEDRIDPSIPDASLWTTDDVFTYFFKYFPQEAKVFKEQEIDGRSLLLMKRLDVLKSLNLKIGPALNIYRHIVKLQYRRDDPRLYWL